MITSSRSGFEGSGGGGSHAADISSEELEWIIKFRKPVWMRVVWTTCKAFGLFLFVYLLLFIAKGEPGRDLRDKIERVQVLRNDVDRKLDDGISLVRKEFNEKKEKTGHEINTMFKALKVRSIIVEEFIDGLKTKGFLNKEEFGVFFEEFMKKEIRDYARQIVEKEIKRHMANGLEMVDYALPKVLRHSETYGPGGRAEKMIRPSFGEPGKCFPLKGDSGFVEIRLRAAIVPVAVTLEHVAKNVAYDRFDAPKNCRVYGWMQGQVPTDDMEIDKSKFLLTEFTYDLEKSNAQTFMVEAAAYGLVDTVRLDFTSNQGNASHTCIYRLRIHGREPV